MTAPQAFDSWPYSMNLKGKYMKRMFTLMITLAFVLSAAGHASAWVKGNPAGKGNPQGKFSSAPPPFQVSYEDGTYRGIFADRGDIQVALQFTLVDNHVTAISFRQLFHSGIDYLTGKDYVTVQGIKEQHQALINYLIGKDIRSALQDLYDPGSIVTFEVDKFDSHEAFTGGTLRAGKVISAARDALNRGVYRY